MEFSTSFKNSTLQIYACGLLSETQIQQFNENRKSKDSRYGSFLLGVCKKRDQISLGGIIHNPLLRLLSSSSLYSSSKNANTTSYGGRGLSEKKQRLQRCGTPALWKLDDGAFMTEKPQVDCDVALFGGLAKHSVPESHGHRVV
jgi:hypothetical protein